MSTDWLRLHLELFARAEEFFQAYKDLPKRAPPSWPRYFLLCQAAELALKAYLVWRGVSVRDLMKHEIRHSLKGLMTQAIDSGLAIGPLARGEIELLDEAHAKHWPRYPRPDEEVGKPLFVIDYFEAYVGELLRAVGDALFARPAPLASSSV